NTLKKPMVWAPLIAVALVLAGARVPPLIDNMLMLIGSSTSGASIFLAGLIIAAYEIRLNGEVIGNALVKMVAQPLLMVLLVAALLSTANAEATMSQTTMIAGKKQQKTMNAAAIHLNMIYRTDPNGISKSMTETRCDTCDNNTGGGVGGTAGTLVGGGS